MPGHVLYGIIWVFVLGTGAQYLAWRFRLPSILLLLAFGFVAGPVTGDAVMLSPTVLQAGNWLPAFVSLGIGIILFEGGLTLRIDELREVGDALFRLITLGVLVTWALASVAAYVLVEAFGGHPGPAVLIGALLTVTGPTVIIPMLRSVRPEGRVGALAKWEGITIDPIAAILATLVFEGLLYLAQPAPGAGLEGTLTHALTGLGTAVFVSIGISLVGAAFLVAVLRRHLVPDYLVNPLALTTVAALFGVSNYLQPESGLITTTLMGVMLANQPYASVQRITEFKETLQVLLIASLFIVLSASLDPGALAYVNTGSLLFLGALVLVIRPLAVWLSSLGTTLDWRETVFMSWLAPRGIVAAGVASLFAFRLETLYPTGAAALVPVVFLVIVGTSAVYGLTLYPLARYLGLAQPTPQGVLLVGAHEWGRQIARALSEQGMRVLLVDANAGKVKTARQEGLPAQQANVLSEGIAGRLDLSGIGYLLAATSNEEVNTLAALHFSEVFESAETFQLGTRPERQPGSEEALPLHLRGRPLFGEDATFASLARRFRRGAEIRKIEVPGDFSLEAFQEQRGEHVIPLFVARKDGKLYVFSDETPPRLHEGDTLLALADPEAGEDNLEAAPQEEPSGEMKPTNGGRYRGGGHGRKRRQR